MSEEKFDYEGFESDLLAAMKRGEPLLGKSGALGPLLKHVLELGLEAEMDDFMDEQRASSGGNRRNGKQRKQVHSETGGQFELETPRDRHGEFEPQLVKKRQVVISDTLVEQVLSLYALGMSYRDIQANVEKLYGFGISKERLEKITDQLNDQRKEWQARTLESLYCFVFFDCMFVKIRRSGVVKKTAVYHIIGINPEGKKELLGAYLADEESATFWLSVLNDLKARGVEDILIACVDGLTGFPKSIEIAYPKTIVQLCIVHQIRNSTAYIGYKDRKDFCNDLKTVYQAASAEAGYDNLKKMQEKWGKKGETALKGWFNKWEDISPFFDFAPEIRRIMYTTNIIEGYHRQLRKTMKSKGAFTSEPAFTKLHHALSMRIVQQWKRPSRNWPEVLANLMLIFEQRFKVLRYA